MSSTLVLTHVILLVGSCKCKYCFILLLLLLLDFHKKKDYAYSEFNENENFYDVSFITKLLLLAYSIQMNTYDACYFLSFGAR